MRQRTYAALGIGPGPERGRLVALLAVAGAIVVVAIALAIASGNHGGNPKLVLTHGTSTTAGPTAAGVSPGTPSVTDTLPPATNATTAPATTVAPATTTVPATTTTVPPTTTSSPSTTAAVPECATNALSAAVTAGTNNGTTPIPKAQPVPVSVTVTNTSTATCQITHWMAPIPSDITITAIGSKALVWQPAVTGGTPSSAPPKVLGPGQSYVWTTLNWAQDGCVDPCTGASDPRSTPAQAGVYVASPRDPPPGVVGPPAIFMIG
jgi:hypothetical protein